MPSTLFDAFTFFNELELLELRCEELKGIVDRHFLIESPTTFQGRSKPLHYENNASLFKKYPIEHIIVELPYKGHPNPDEIWRNEFAARDLGYGEVVERLDPNDVVLLSDADEIPRASQIFNEPHQTIAIAMMPLFSYWLNYQSDELWAGTIRLPAWQVSQKGGQAAFIQRKNHGEAYKIMNGGWHFSYQGGVTRIQNKISAFAHVEYNTMGHLDPNGITSKMKTGKDIFGRDKQYREVPIDNHYPAYLVEHPERFRHMIYYE